MAGKRYTRGVSRGARREISWLDLPFTSTGFVADSAAIMLSLTAFEKARRPFTIVRTYLEILFLSDQIAASESQLAALGICVISDQAEAIGITAVPTPLTDLASDYWLLHQVLVGDFTFVSAVGVDAQAGRRYTIDSKAMRKVSDDQDVVVVGEADAISEGCVITLAGRLLIKEY